MIYPITYYRPTNLEEALHQLREPEALAFAGGGLLFSGTLLPYPTLIDLQDIPELSRVLVDPQDAHIGGAAALEAVASADWAPLRLRQSITRVLPINQRNGISISESLTVAEPPQEWLAALAALDAYVHHLGHQKSQLAMTPLVEHVTEFMAGRQMHPGPYEGIILELRIPRLNDGAVLGSAQIARTPRDYPIVTAFVRLAQEDGQLRVRAALGGVDALPVVSYELHDWLGGKLDDAALAQAAAAIGEQVQPLDDLRGSAEYRRAMTPVVLRRALEDAREQFQA